MNIENTSETYTNFYASDNSIECFINTNYKKYGITKKQFITYIVGNPMGECLNLIGTLTKNPNSIVRIHKFN